MRLPCLLLYIIFVNVLNTKHPTLPDMIESRYLCATCNNSRFIRSPDNWQCDACGRVVPCCEGIPKFYSEEDLGESDLRLLRRLYDGFFGRFYNLCGPMILLPARPFCQNIGYWVIHVAMLSAFTVVLVILYSWSTAFIPADYPLLGLVGPIVFLAVIAATVPPLIPHLVLTIPTKISLERHKYRAHPDFKEVHRELIDQLKQSETSLSILDVSTGTANSLIRHGWLELEADFVCLDYSQIMLKQAKQYLEKSGVQADLVQADVAEIPIKDETFDIVLNYGALNGYENAGLALREMLRVCKKGGTVIVFDEQLYPEASLLEKLYFRCILSRHDMHTCFPETLLQKDQVASRVVHQIYEFYYLAVITKRS